MISNLQLRILVISYFFLLGCTNNVEKKEIEFLENYLNHIDYPEASRINKILIITPYTICSFCIDEIKYHNKMNSIDPENYLVDLIMIEKYAKNFQKYIESLNISVNSIQDSTAYFIENNPTFRTSVVIRFDSLGNVQSILDLGLNDKIKPHLIN